LRGCARDATRHLSTVRDEQNLDQCLNTPHSLVPCTGAE
jgi:hypothetical protein